MAVKQSLSSTFFASTFSITCTQTLEQIEKERERESASSFNQPQKLLTQAIVLYFVYLGFSVLFRMFTLHTHVHLKHAESGANGEEINKKERKHKIKRNYEAFSIICSKLKDWNVTWFMFSIRRQCYYYSGLLPGNILFFFLTIRNVWSISSSLICFEGRHTLWSIFSFFVPFSFGSIDSSLLPQRCMQDSNACQTHQINTHMSTHTFKIIEMIVHNNNRIIKIEQCENQTKESKRNRKKKH